MRLRLVALGAALVALAGCGSGSAALSRTHGDGGTHAHQAAQSSQTAAGNRTATVAEAKRLLALAPIPTGATKVSPSARGAPALGVPQTSSLVDRHRRFVVDERFQQVYAWAKAHPPKRMQLAGSSSTATRGVLTSEGIAWSEPNKRYADELGMSIEVAPTDHHEKTMLYADGYGEWLDPRPIRDRPDGPRYHVDLADGCPAKTDPSADVRNQGSDLTHHLLPHAPPTAALICEYDGSNRRPHFGLGRSAPLGPAAARKLAQRFQRLPISHIHEGIHGCPADDRTGNLVVFSFPNRQDVDLLAKANGCQRVVNGDILVNGGVSYRPWVRPLPI